MSHPIAPLGFRLGKTFLWHHANVLVPENLRKVVSSKLNLVKGLESVTKTILLRRGYYPIKFNFKVNPVTGTYQGKILYYPILNVPVRERIIPTYFVRRPFIRFVRKYNKNFGRLLRRLWLFKKDEFDHRFVSSKKKINYNRWLTLGMLRGSKLRKWKQFRKLKKKLAVPLFHKKIKRLFFRSSCSRKNKWWTRWLRSAKKGLPPKFLTRLFKVRIGIRIIFKTQNIFSYLARKNKKFTYKMHQQHLWNPRYKNQRFDFPIYYDLVNSLYLFCRFSHLDQLVIQMIQYGLVRMHRSKLKPRRFFNFLDKVIKNFSDIPEVFHAFRLIITGKLAGGTARTNSLSIGFGILPRQTLSAEISFAFGDVGSKYGSYGVKLITWRKSPDYEKILPETPEASLSAKNS